MRYRGAGEHDGLVTAVAVPSGAGAGGTDQEEGMMEDKPEIGQAGAEIEITPEMVNAGLVAIRPYLESDGSLRCWFAEAVVDVLRAGFQSSGRDVRQVPSTHR